MRNIYLILTLIVAISNAQNIKVNQVSYFLNSDKIAVIPGNTTDKFYLINADNQDTVYTGIAETSAYYPSAEETVQVADFSDFTSSGTYYISSDNGEKSYSFRIQQNASGIIYYNAIRAYYFQRASTALEEQYAGEYAREAGHPDDEVFIHESAQDSNYYWEMPSPKGWYDAGDYGKYIVNSGISTYTLLATYEHFPEFVKAIDHNIPESGDDVPDILDEAKWNLDWMLTMQDSVNGAVFHKLTTQNFVGSVMPNKTNARRYIVMRTTSATLNFAAVMAQASRIFKDYETQFPGYADSCLAAAERAWVWARANPAVYYVQPDDIQTGTYGDRYVGDEFDWAAAELYVTTKNNEYYTATNLSAAPIGTPNWNYVSGLPWMTLGHFIDDLTSIADSSAIANKIVNYADDLLDELESSAYRISNDNFNWGSNSNFLNDAMMILQAYSLTEDEKYINAAIANLDYIMGKNATGYCFVTGMGSKSPMNIHHRVSKADGIDAPVPGLVAGGPNSGQQDNCDYESDLPALSYVDDYCSYASNEVTINWNAPLVYVSAALQSYLGNHNILSTSKQSILDNKIVINNPSNGSFDINSQFVGTSYELYDMQGSLIQQGTLNASIGDILESGIYIIRVSYSDKTITQKLIKE